MYRYSGYDCTIPVLYHTLLVLLYQLGPKCFLIHGQYQYQDVEQEGQLSVLVSYQPSPQNQESRGINHMNPVQAGIHASHLSLFTENTEIFGHFLGTSRNILYAISALIRDAVPTCSNIISLLQPPGSLYPLIPNLRCGPPENQENIYELILNHNKIHQITIKSIKSRSNP